MNEAEVTALLQLLTALAPTMPLLIQQLKQSHPDTPAVDLVALHNETSANFERVIAAAQ